MLSCNVCIFSTKVGKKFDFNDEGGELFTSYTHIQAPKHASTHIDL